MLYNLIQTLDNGTLDMENNSNILDINFNWRKFVKFNKKTYNKTTLFSNDNYELVIISWLPHQHTKLHLHPKNGCLMKILYGELNEIRHNQSKILENKYKSNDISYMHDKFGKHIISNINSKPAISLHLYSPANFYK